jgi:preprotein translocase SecE subunit
MALELYKPDEATRTRGFIALLLALLVGYGVYSMHEFFAFGFWQRDLFSGYPDHRVTKDEHDVFAVASQYQGVTGEKVKEENHLPSEVVTEGQVLHIPGDDPNGGILGAEFPLSPRVLMCLGLTLAAAFGIYTLSNHPRVVDFLIETEKELQNVSWSPRHEVISNSIIVVITVIIVAIYLGSIDYLLALARNEVPWQKLWDSLLGSGGS